MPDPSEIKQKRDDWKRYSVSAYFNNSFCRIKIEGEYTDDDIEEDDDGKRTLTIRRDEGGDLIPINLRFMHPSHLKESGRTYAIFVKVNDDGTEENLLLEADGDGNHDSVLAEVEGNTYWNSASMEGEQIKQVNMSLIDEKYNGTKGKFQVKRWKGLDGDVFNSRFNGVNFPHEVIMLDENRDRIDFVKIAEAEPAADDGAGEVE